jgi:hypothetical protein
MKTEKIYRIEGKRQKLKIKLGTHSIATTAAATAAAAAAAACIHDPSQHPHAQLNSISHNELVVNTQECVVL